MKVLRFRQVALLALGCVLLTFAACRGKPEAPKTPKAESPVAQARQQVATPTLAAKPTETPLPPEVKPEAQEVARAEPRGPITLPPSPAAEPEAAKPEIEVPATAPLATLEGATPAPPEPAAPEGTDVQALAAPALTLGEPAKPAEAQPVLYEPKLVTAKTNVDIILDASGSMSAPFGMTSQSKFDMVRGALFDIIYEMAQQQEDFPRNVAVRLFGAGSPASDKNCKDTELLIGMGMPDLGGIRKMLDPVKPQGASPIALAITDAQTDFPQGPADRVIVLIADGSDTCEGDPCRSTEELEALPVKTVINVVAFDVSPLDQERLTCIAEKSDGQFFLARNANELYAALDQAINSTLPYNLKLSAQAGATPLPFNISIFKAGTENVIKKDKSHGTKLIRLAPGSYDILVEYAESPEGKKPSKILKGVEILETTKVEQTINFDLGQLTVSAVDNAGKIVPAEFIVLKANTQQPIANIQTDAEATTFFLTPGVYDITADLVESGIEGFSLIEKGVQVKAGEAADRLFRFQKGTLALKGITTQKTTIPFVFQSYKTGRADILVASGALPAEGGSVQLAPGTYDLLVIGADPKMMASPRTKISGVEVKAAQTTELTATFEMGKLTLAAIDGKGNRLPAEFIVRDTETQIEMAKMISEGGSEVTVPIPPGTYDIVASSLKSVLEPRPSVPVSGVVVKTDKPVKRVIKFVLGTIRLRGQDAKGRPIRSKFSVYKAASDELVSQAPPTDGWMVFDLAPGTYDSLAINVDSQEEPKPMIWLRDIVIEDGKTVSHEAIFTAGKLKIIGRGPNNKVITVRFKVYRYGADTELINGQTGNDWEIFEIEPGSYYLEASYVDERQSVLLKKWVNVTVGENEVVETVLRF